MQLLGWIALILIWIAAPILAQRGEHRWRQRFIALGFLCATSALVVIVFGNR